MCPGVGGGGGGGGFEGAHMKGAGIAHQKF